MQIRENIIPIFLEPLTEKEASEIKIIIARMERMLLESTLTTAAEHSQMMTLRAAEVEGEVVEDYEFIVTRRFKRKGCIFIGGINGEIMNVTAFFEMLEEQAELSSVK